MPFRERTIKVLIVDDDEDDYYIIHEYLKRIPQAKFIIDWCPGYKDAIALLSKRTYDIYLVDYLLGAYTGVDFLKEARKNRSEEPVILLTGKGNIKVDIEAMKLGAVDYLVKPELNVDIIERSMRYALDRANAMKTIKASERKYRALFEQSRDIIFILDPEFSFIDINDAAVSSLGYRLEELLQLNLFDFIRQPKQQDFIRTCLLQQKDILDKEIVIETKDGSLITSTITIVIEKDNPSENEIRYHGIIHDITALKKEEKATLQIEKLAALGRLVRTLAHEVRNPLNNITLSTEQLQQELNEESLYVDIIQRNSKRISDLISELLNTSKPTEIHQEKCVLQSVLDEVIATSIDRLTLKHIKLQVDFPKEQLLIEADKNRLVIALLNIVINAVEAMDEYEGILKLHLFRLNERAVLEISDNGAGISEEHISQLFEPYFTKKRNGMGLGLATTLNILQAHRASIDVVSAVGKGATFTIVFPLVF